jgi:ATP-dependent exoDNAse (exonuclease V) beta subunit
VVVLCEPACHATREQPTRHVDPVRGLWAEPLAGCAPRELLECRAEEQRRDAAEAVRLAYVAATRARDLLVVPGVADAEPAGGWLEALNPAVYPEADSRGEAAPALGCPAFGEDALLERPGSARPERTPVAPGCLRPRTGRHGVVWWDPRALDLEVSQDVGLRQQRILEADREGIAAQEGERAHARWQTRRRETLERGALPSRRVQAVTALAAEEAFVCGEGEIAIEEVNAERGERPHGTRFGTLVHAVLAAVDLSADAACVRAVAALQGRLVGASAAEIAAAACAVTAALHHPVLRDAACSPALRRETPVLLCLDDGRLAEGVVDLAFREAEANRWTVVDFKTDRELGERRAEYRTQLGLYVQAVARATREPARGLLLVV